MRPVQQCTWNWREEAVSPSSRPYLRQSILQTVVMSAVGLLVYFLLGHQIAGQVVMSLAGVVLLLGLFLPSAYARVHTFGQSLGRGVGQLLLYLLMIPFFFLFITPVALYLRLVKRDPLQRGLRDKRWTYWIARSPRARDDNIEKQFLRENRDARLALRPVGSIGGQKKGDAS